MGLSSLFLFDIYLYINFFSNSYISYRTHFIVGSVSLTSAVTAESPTPLEETTRRESPTFLEDSKVETSHKVPEPAVNIEPEWTEEEMRRFIAGLKPVTPIQLKRTGPVVITEISCLNQTVTFKEYTKGWQNSSCGGNIACEDLYHTTY